MMLQKIKGLMAIKEHVDILDSAIKDYSNSLNEMKQQIQDTSNTLNETKKEQKDFLKDIKEDVKSIKEAKEDLKQEVYDFRLLKSQLQNNLLKKFEEELGKELKINIESIKNDIKEYNSLKETVSAILKKVEAVSGELGKFMDISKSIKKEDFELSKFASQLLESDREKLELLRKIDTLERLISKMRRSQRQ